MKHRHPILFIFLLSLLSTLSFAQKHVISRPTTKPKTEQKAKPKPQRKTASSAKPTQRNTSLSDLSEFADFSREKLSDETIVVNGVSFVMKGVQGGVFTMGATAEQGDDAYDDKKLAHRVAVSSFRIGQTEVTQALWQAVMGNNPLSGSRNQGDNLPVGGVSWDDCQEFISRLNQLTGRNFRLPTEAEWEYAARGGNRSKGYKYAGSDNPDMVAWYKGNSGDSRTFLPVASMQPNELGLYDMSGNAWEYCQDWFGAYSPSSQTNPKGVPAGSCHVDRGGSVDYDASLCRVSVRGQVEADYRYFDRGLRLAL